MRTKLTGCNASREDSTEAGYQVSEFYAPGSEAGLSPFDPRLGLSWPLDVSEISEKDRAWAALASVEAEVRRKMTLNA